MASAVGETNSGRLAVTRGEDFVTFHVWPSGMRGRAPWVIALYVVMFMLPGTGLSAVALVALNPIRFPETSTSGVFLLFVFGGCVINWVGGYHIRSVKEQARRGQASLTVTGDLLIVRTSGVAGDVGFCWNREELHRIYPDVGFVQYLPWESRWLVPWYPDRAVWIVTRSEERIPVLAGHFLAGSEVRMLAAALNETLELN